MKKNNVAIILSGGSGQRFNKEINGPPKQLFKIAGKSLLEHTLEKFERSSRIDEIILVINKENKKDQEKIIKKAGFKKIRKIVLGGKTRQESSKNGIFSCCEKKTSKVLIHDAVRPFISNKIIDQVLDALDKYSAVDVAIPVADTLIKINEKNVIVEIPRRLEFRRGQTPQGFNYETIKKAHQLATINDFKDVTDDCGLVKRYHLADIFVVEGEEENIKITQSIDLHIADKLFQIKNLKVSYKKEDLQKKLRNKKILVFGHSSGIGESIFEICQKFEAKAEGHSLTNGCDIRDFKKTSEVIREFVKKNGKIDILISTPAILIRKKLLDFSLEEIEKQIEINYFAQINIVKEAISQMSKGGSIALFSSSSYTRGRETYSIYSSTKAAIVNFVQAVSEEIFPRIKINAICPYRTNTPARRKNFGPEDLKSLLDPQEVALVTLKTCLSNVTGQVISFEKK